VKDQGEKCMSCWAFSASGAVEADNFIRTGVMSLFSAQQLVDCSDGGYGNSGCNGGNFESAFGYIKKWGIMGEANYPYTGYFNSQCGYEKSKATGTIKGYTKVPYDSVDQLKAAIVITPVGVMV
jgi:hypothetical protein